MNKIKEFFTDWSWKEKAWLAFVLIVQTVAWAIQKESLFMLVMTLTSSLNLVLGAKGKVPVCILQLSTVHYMRLTVWVFRFTVRSCTT